MEFTALENKIVSEEEKETWFWHLSKKSRNAEKITLKSFPSFLLFMFRWYINIILIFFSSFRLIQISSEHNNFWEKNDNFVSAFFITKNKFSYYRLSFFRSSHFWTIFDRHLFMMSSLWDRIITVKWTSILSIKGCHLSRLTFIWWISKYFRHQTFKIIKNIFQQVFLKYFIESDAGNLRIHYFQWSNSKLRFCFAS